MVRRDDIERFQAQKVEAGLSKDPGEEAKETERLQKQVEDNIKEINRLVSGTGLAGKMLFNERGQLVAPSGVSGLDGEVLRRVTNLASFLLKLIEKNQERGLKIPDEYIYTGEDPTNEDLSE